MPLLKRLILSCTFAVAMCATAASGETVAGNTSSDKPIVITMKSMSFDPKRLEVPIGASVVWANKAHSKHTATSDNGKKTFDTGEIKPGDSSKPVKFEKEGEFKYYCLIHGKTMSGIIVVTAAGKK